MASAPQQWASYYANKRTPANFAPESFVVRVFCSRAPVQFLDGEYRGKSILDLGCGHGRHVPFLLSLGFDVTGLEVSSDQVRRLRDTFEDVPFLRGTAARIPVEDDSFDFLLACNSVYYLEDAESGFQAHMRECARVLRPGGRFVFSMVGEQHTILDGAGTQGPGLYVVQHDFLGFRNGAVLRAFTQADTDALFAPFAIDQHGEIVERVAGTCRHLHYFVATAP